MMSIDESKSHSLLFISDYNDLGAFETTRKYCMKQHYQVCLKKPAKIQNDKS